MEHYGVLSLVPPILAILLAWWSKEVILSLFLGVFSGAMILNGFNPIIGFVHTLDKYLMPSLANPWNAGIIIFLLTMGGMVGIINKAGGVSAIGKYIASKAKSIKKTQFATWLMGVLIFFDDYANTLIVGNTMRPITDKMKISREKLSFIVDLTAAAVSSIVPISTWIAFEVGLIRDGFESIGVEASAYTTFIKTIPYRFYSIFALIFALVIIFTVRDFGPMYEAEVRARKKGEVLKKGSNPIVSDEIEEIDITQGKHFSFFEAFLPIIGVILITLFGLWYNGGGLAADVTIRDAFGKADASIVLLWAAFVGTLIAAILALTRRILSVEEIMKSWVNGAKSMFIACSILVLAWSIGSITEDLGTANFLVGILEGNIPGFIVPVLLFVISAFIAFTIGSAWGTVAIVMPLAIPLGYTMEVSLLPVIAAVLTAGVMGDHCSPISDTTIMSSTASAVDHIDHVKTQIPYVLVIGIVAALIGFIPAGFGVSPIILLPLGGIVIYLLVKWIGKKVTPEALEQVSVSDVNLNN